MTSRLVKPSPEWDQYATLVNEALHAFLQDVTYAVEVVESARSISDKKRNAIKKSKTKL